MNTELRFGSVAPIWSPARTWRGARLRQGAFTGSGRLASHHPRMHHDALDVTYNPRWLSEERLWLTSRKYSRRPRTVATAAGARPADATCRWQYSRAIAPAPILS